MEKDELSRIQEKFKLNFFQIEKLLALYEDRLRALEKKNSLIAETDKKVNIVKKDSVDLKNSVKKTNKRVENKIEDFELIAKDNKKIIVDIEKEMDILHKDFLAKTKNLENTLNKKVISMNSSSLATEKKMVEFTKTRMAEFYKQTTNTLAKKDSEFKELENSINKKIKRVEALGSKLPKIEDNVNIFNKNYQDWKIFSIGLEEDKKLYLELRKVVLGSIEKLRNLENVFNQNLEEFEEINNRIEGNEKTYKEMSEKTKNEMVRLDEKAINIEKSVEEYKIKLKDKLTKRFEELDNRIENEINVKIREQDNLLSSYGSKFTEMEQRFKELENETIPKKIDKEFNEMLIILRDKLKDLVTLNDFEKIRGELRTKIEQVRMPEILPMEKRVGMMETDLEEVKRLLRGLSQRLPVVLE